MAARKPLGTRMTDGELKQVVHSELQAASGSLLGSDGGGDLADRRRQAMDYYYGEPFGNEIEGRSQVVLTDVHDVIEWMLPGLVEIFTASNDVVRFDPTGPEDEAFAKQATEYSNFIFYKDNNGFKILYDWFKDALLQKTGVVKVYWEESEKKKRETFRALSAEEMQLLLSEDNIEAIEHTENDDGTHDLAIHVKNTVVGRVIICGVAPENFIISRRAEDIEGAGLVGERRRATVSDLIEEGYDRDILENIPSHDESEFTEERQSRFQADDDWPLSSNSIDPAMREIWVYELYLKVDYDGDGVAELRKVTCAGTGYVLLDNEPVDDVPYVGITPIPVPHKFVGMSVADEVMDIQLINSTIARQLLDNMYLANNARTAVNERVNLDDLLVQRPGSVVRVEGSEPIGDSIAPIQTQSIGNFAFQMLEYMNSVKENRTGITRYNQGTDADSLNKTATGVSIIQSAAMKRQALIARIFAQGVERLMKKILKLVINNQQQERIVRLRNEWVPMDPRSWNADMDVSIAVGLGYGNKDQQMAILTQWMGIAKSIVELQGGVSGPMLKLEHVRNAAAKWLEAGGMKNVESFVAEISPEDQQALEQQTQQPSPEAIKAQADMQQAQIDGQMAQQKAQFDAQAAQMNMEIKTMDMEHARESHRLRMTELYAKHETTMTQLAAKAAQPVGGSQQPPS